LTSTANRKSNEPSKASQRAISGWLACFVIYAFNLIGAHLRCVLYLQHAKNMNMIFSAIKIEKRQLARQAQKCYIDCNHGEAFHAHTNYPGILANIIN
jgi:hypothetical protein